MNINMNKIRQINGLVESFYLAAFTAAASYAKFLVEQGGFYTLPLMPVLELVKAKLYWSKSSQPGFNDSPLKIGLNRTFNAFKVLASAAGVGLALAGLVSIGFAVMIGSAYLSTARSLGKAIRSGIEGDRKKVANNLHKAAVGGMIATGFLFMTFFPPLAWLGGLFVLITAGHLILSTLPSVLANVPVPGAKNIEPININHAKNDQPIMRSGVGFKNMIRHSLPISRIEENTALIKHHKRNSFSS